MVLAKLYIYIYKFSTLLILVDEYSPNKNKIEMVTYLREYWAMIFIICDVSNEFGHF